MTEMKRHKNKSKERGITLIALVITIIVLLILAGVALSTLTGDSGILNNAESAKGKTNLSNAKEQIELAVQGALTEAYTKGERTISREDLKDEMDNVIGVGKYKLSEGEAPWTVKVGEYETQILANGGKPKERDTKTLAGILTTEGTTPWLPDGFSRVTKFNEGLVIANTTNGTEGTQNYVWIEVPNNIKQTITVDSTEKTISLTEATTNKEITEWLEVYLGKGTSTSYRGNGFIDEWYDSNGNNVATEANKDDSAGCGMTYSQYQTAYSNMLNSIKKYGGFWLAQYEAGIAYEEEHGKNITNRTSTSEGITSYTSANYAKDQYAYNYVKCSEAQKIANADSVEGEYTSSLPFGIQWDLVLKFLVEKQAKTYDEIATNSKWGNHSNLAWESSENSKYSEDYGESFTEGSFKKDTGSYLLTTGAISKVKLDSVEYIANPMNIYDFTGNVDEWTLEHVGMPAYPCVFRGANYNGMSIHGPSKSVLARGYRTINENGWGSGFRSVLY